MFKSFRLIGVVATNTPFTLLTSGSHRIVILSVGHSWQAYDCSNLRIVFIGPKLKKKIRALACDGTLIFSAIKGGIEVCSRVERIAFKKLNEDQNIIQMLRLGPLLICLLDDDSISIWKTEDLDHLIGSFKLSEGFEASCMTHLDTYVNKILIGSETGALELWNFMTKERLYSFNGWGAGIYCLEPAPALDVIGIGLSNGHIILLNVRYNEVIFKFDASSNKKSKSFGGFASCTCLSFSSGVGTPLLASGGFHGSISVWNLEEQELLCTKEDSHSAPIASLCFFSSSLTLMSSSEDNSLKQWTVDINAKELRLLRQRSGPQTTPALLKFCPDGLNLLACDKQSSLWRISTIQDEQTRQFSSKKIVLSGKPLALDSCSVRERDWGNVFSAHDGQKNPCLWNLKKFSIDRHSFEPSLTQSMNVCFQVTSVALSQCGNFGFVGYSCGNIHKFNMQSGLHRGSFTRHQNETAHNGSVISLATDQLNKKILSAGLDGFLCIWKFNQRTLLFQFSWNQSISEMIIHPGNSLVALALADLSIRLFDFESYRVVRHFQGTKDRITCLEIGSNGRWLLVSSMDRTLRIFDIPSATQIQALFFQKPIVCFSFSPTLEMLATAHLNHKGVTLWVNQLLFGSSDSFPKSQEDHLPVLDDSLEPGKKIMRLAMTPVGNWSINYNISLKERTQAIQPKKQRPAAPFFLPPLLPSNAPEMQLTAIEPEQEVRECKPSGDSEFQRQLQNFQKTRDRIAFLTFLKKQSIVYIEQEILSLSSEHSHNPIEDFQPSQFEDVSTLLQFVDTMVDSEEDIEFIQALLKMVLHINSALFISVGTLATQVAKIQEKLDKQWRKLESLLEATQCMISLFIGLHE